MTATNTSAEAWELKPGPHTGVHVQFTVQNDAGDYLHTGYAGLMRRTVEPGGSLDLTLAVPPLADPGRYLIRVDLMDGTQAGVPIRQTGFYQFGADPLLLIVNVSPELPQPAGSP